MENNRYSPMLMALTYMDTFFTNDSSQREAILELASKDELLVGMTDISMVLIEILVKVHPRLEDREEVIRLIREHSLKSMD